MALQGAWLTRRRIWNLSTLSCPLCSVHLLLISSTVSWVFVFEHSYLCLSIRLWNQSNLPVLLPKYIMFSTNWLAIKLPANIEVWPRGGLVNCPCLYLGYSPCQEFSPSCMFFVKETPENFTNLLHTLHAYCVIFCTLSVVWSKTHFCL